MKRVWIMFSGMAFLLALVFSTQAAEPFKIAYVDMQKALNLSLAGMEAKKVMTLEVEKMERSFSGKQKETG